MPIVHDDCGTVPEEESWFTSAGRNGTWKGPVATPPGQREVVVAPPLERQTCPTSAPAWTMHGR
jgi:hypothetical protein